MTSEEISRVDRSNLFTLLREFPSQVKDAAAIDVRLRVSVRGVQHIVMSGLGGSAIGGDLLRSALAGELRIPFIVNRHYTLPAFVGPHSLVIVSSYSGNTEETIAAHREALRRKARVVCISSNGTTEDLARKGKSPFIKIPAGFPPRAALGYSFFPLLRLLATLGFIKDKAREIRETILLLEKKSAEYGDPERPGNGAIQLAEQLRGRIGVVYSSTERLDAVATRWRGQIAENGKSLMFGNVIPEMNHNELVGWKALTGQMRDIQVVFLRDHNDHARVQLRMDITREILHRHTPRIAEVWTEGSSPLARMFSLITLGDWTSFYLAILHGEDPTPVAVIDHLKSELGKV